MNIIYQEQALSKMILLNNTILIRKAIEFIFIIISLNLILI